MKANKRVLILGATGFIGGAIARKFAEDPSFAVERFSSSDFDLTKESAVQKLSRLVDDKTIVVFAAGIPRDRGDTLELFHANATMAINAARAFRDHPPECVVYCSSAGVYDDIPDPLPVNESAVLSPKTSLYCVAKLASERVLESAAKASAFRLIILRICRIYGPGEKRALYGPSEFLDCAMKGKSIRIWGDGEDSKDFVYIDDLAHAAKMLATTGQEGAFTIATGKNTSFLETAKLAMKIASRPVELRFTPRTKPPIREGYDNSKLKMALNGYQMTSLEAGLAATYKSLCQPSAKRK